MQVDSRLTSSRSAKDAHGLGSEGECEEQRCVTIGDVQVEMLRYSANPEKGRTQGASAAFNQVSLLAKGQTSPLISAAAQFLRPSAQRNLVTM